MSEITRRIGLSLGADLCWPLCYEAIVKRLDLALPIGGDTVRFDVKRLTIEPFDLKQPANYDVVMDRLTHWYHTSREWIKKAILMDGVYVLNNPWSLQSMEKQTTYCAMMRLGLPVPDTWMVPPKDYEPTDDLKPTLERYAKLFDLGAVGKALGYPMFMKPYDGGAWRGVSRIDDEKALREAYDGSGRLLMHLQKAVDPHDYFARCVGIGPQVRVIRYDPSAPLHARYCVDTDGIDDADRTVLENMTLTINSFFGWDFNSCEGLRQDGTWYPIDFANACPDSQVTSLHYHFPWLVTSKVKWSLFCAATGRKMHMNLHWQPFFDIADANPDMSLEERLEAYAAIARERLQVDAFEEFCATHLGEVDAVADEFFAGDEAKAAVHQKVTSLFPAHEVETFTDHFWDLIQQWRHREGPSAAPTGAPPSTTTTDQGAAEA